MCLRCFYLLIRSCEQLLESYSISIVVCSKLNTLMRDLEMLNTPWFSKEQAISHCRQPVHLLGSMCNDFCMMPPGLFAGLEPGAAWCPLVVRVSPSKICETLPILGRQLFTHEIFRCCAAAKMMVRCQAPKNSRTGAICASSSSIGAWPTPGISTKLALGPRRVISRADPAVSRSELAPRKSSVGQVMAS